jgi:hypothetical protein
MARSLINLGLYKIKFTDLAANAKTIHDGLLAQILLFPIPNPTMVIFQGDIDALNTAIVKWGLPGNRGSKADYNALVAAANKVKNDLRMLADYAQNTKPDDPNSWMLAGFVVRRSPSSPAPLGIVQNLRNFISRTLPSPVLKIRWKRPLDTDPGDVKGYVIQRNNTSDYPASSQGIANVIAVVVNTSFEDSNPLPGENWYWITPFNSLGLGVTSDGLKIVSTIIPE